MAAATLVRSSSASESQLPGAPSFVPKYKMHAKMRGLLLRHLVFAAICFECTSYTESSTLTTNAPAAVPPPPPVSTASHPTAAPAPNCTAVAHLLQARGLKSSDILSDPTKDSIHRFCDLPATGSCCTYKIETHLSSHTKEAFQKNTKDLIGKLSNVLGARAHKLNEYFTELLVESKKEFHNMFKRTYGNIYEENSYVFSNLFTELENYFTRGKVDLAVSMDSFFNILYQKMFTVLNSQYILDDKYLGCVSEHMKELKPFGDVPDKLSVQIKRSFVATRTYAQALNIAAEMTKALMNVRINTDCTAALTRMQQCNVCKGYAQKPCANYCVNVMRGCLQHYVTLDTEWDTFVAFMEKVADRLLGPFNIVMVVEPINIKISEAIMNYQETERAISEQVFKGCGDPVLGRRSQADRIKKSTSHEDGTSFGSTMNLHEVDSDLYIQTNRTRRSVDAEQNDNYDSSEQIVPPTQVQRTQRDRRKNKKKGNGNKKGLDKDDDSFKEPSLDKIVKDIKLKIKDLKKFWSNLPYQLCNIGELASVPPGSNETCWNGHDVVEQEVATRQEPGGNSESISQTPQQKNMVTSQLYYLKTAVSNLRNAYNGLDVEWPDQEEPFESSGYGSGDGDDDDLETGSGSSAFEESVPKQSETPSVYVSTASSGGTNATGTKKTVGSNTYENEVIKGSGASPNVPQMSLRRALIMYLFPIYMAWFGGIISDLL